jgi:hypothetical protein
MRALVAQILVEAFKVGVISDQRTVQVFRLPFRLRDE